MEITAIEDARVREAMNYYLLNLASTVPPNTLKAYKPKQEEWKRWCAENWPPIPHDWAVRQSTWASGLPLPGDLVDEGKLLLFMKTEVVSRAPRKGARLEKQKKRRTAAPEQAAAAKRRRLVDGDTIEVSTTPLTVAKLEEDDAEPLLARPALQLAYNSVRLYISAIQRLYEEQKSRNINPAPRPQGIALKALKKSILAVVWARRRAEYEDPLEGTIKDSYTKAQVPQHHAAAWQVDGDISCLLRTQVDFLLGNHMLLRQSNRRPMELPDCFRLELPNEGQKSREFPTYALVVVMNQGKTNQHGRMEYGAALRHRDVRSCLVGALAFYFFWRWQVEGVEQFPTFQRSEDWYDLKVLRRSAKEPEKQLSPQTANSWTQKLYTRCGIRTSKLSHAPRVAAAQNADMDGVSEGQIRRAGRWNNGDQMTGCYLTSLPFEFMRSSADFDPDWSGSYFLPRDTVKPPLTLCQRIWPALDKWKQAHDADSPSVEANRAAGAFLELLGWLRTVLLQDAVFLRKHYPLHPLFQDPVFRSAEFATFAQYVEDACRAAEEDSYMATIDRAIPAVAEKLRALSSQQSAASFWMERAFSELAAQNRELAAQNRRLAEKLDELSEAEYTLTINPGRSTVSRRPEMPKRGRPTVPTAPGRVATPISPQPRAAAAPSGPPTARGEQGTASQPPAPPAEQGEVPKFGVPLDVRKISDLWHVWRHGRAGMPSLESLEATYGSDWRPRSQKSVFCGRKAIVDFILRKSRERGGAESAAQHARVISQMEQLCSNWSLDKVTKAIKSGDLEQRWPLEA